MATPPSELAGAALHAEALQSVRHYDSLSWDVLQPKGDMPYAGPPRGGAAFSPTDVEHFCREGFVVLRGFYTEEEVKILRAATTETLSRLGKERKGEQSSADMTFAPVTGPADPANPNRVGYINDLHLHEPALQPTRAHPKMLSCLTELLGPDIDAWQVATVVKSPGMIWAGGGYGWHQDIADYGGSGDTDGSSTSFRYHGMTNFANVCAITYLSACSPDNGATSVVPRSHRCADGSEGPVRRPLFTTGATDGLWNGPYRTVEGIDQLESSAVTPTVVPGDVLLFDSWICHRANINRSDESKIGLINVYCRPDTLPLAGPLATGKGALGLALVRGGALVDLGDDGTARPEAGGAGGERGWGDAHRRGQAKL